MTMASFALRSTCHHTVSFGCGGADAYIILCSGFLIDVVTVMASQPCSEVF